MTGIWRRLTRWRRLCSEVHHAVEANRVATQRSRLMQERVLAELDRQDEVRGRPRPPHLVPIPGRARGG